MSCRPRLHTFKMLCYESPTGCFLTKVPNERADMLDGQWLFAINLWRLSRSRAGSYMDSLLELDCTLDIWKNELPNRTENSVRPEIRPYGDIDPLYVRIIYEMGVRDFIRIYTNII